MDVFMAFRETIFILLGVPTFIYGIKILLKLKNPNIVSTRIFLRGKAFLGVLRDLFYASIFGFAASLFLFGWWFTNSDLFRVPAGISFIALIYEFLSAFKKLNSVLEA